MNRDIPGKLTARDETIAHLLKWIPWLSFFLASLPVPTIFLVLFLAATATDSAAIYFLLCLLSLGVGLFVGLLSVIFLLIYRRRWLSRLRDKLAADGITADEVSWFTPELTSAERDTLREIERQNPLLADAYTETLASRLTATRIIAKARGEQLKIERRINRARAIVGADTTSLLSDLDSDHDKVEELTREAAARLAEAKARLQMIEASASRTLNKTETDSMLRRLSAAQEHFPLAIEMAKLEQEAVQEADFQARTSEVPSNTTGNKRSSRS
jgi:hypothetical protein